MQPAADVSCELVLDVHDRAQLLLQVVAAGTTGGLSVEHDGRPVGWSDLPTGSGGRAQDLTVPAGRVVVRYAAHVPERPAAHGVDPLERLVMLRPSRYCPSDRMAAVAADALGGAVCGPEETAVRLAQWVAGRTAYVLGSSGGSDDALDTLLTGRGVCRDHAHLLVALCRAVDVPARTVAAYAPGLSPMDFHAVVEVAVGDRWQVLDATGLAPRQALVRVATGRDAADTAFLTSVGGAVDLVQLTVGAVTTGDLPVDDGTAVVLA